MNKTLLVAAIKNGSVIDHILASQALIIMQILNLSMDKKIVTVGINLLSKNMKFKDIIKIEDKEISPEEVDRFSFLAPQATINIIRNYKIVKKYKVNMPKSINKIIVCPNIKCISNNEDMESSFYIKQSNEVIKLQCKYCEKIFNQEAIKNYNH